ncbi:hypothetical protein ACWEQL_01315 [Kitasatospora sp. NPDC004240]
MTSPKRQPFSRSFLTCTISPPDRPIKFHSNPFIGVRHEGPTAVLTDDWHNLLTLDLTGPALR